MASSEDTDGLHPLGSVASCLIFADVLFNIPMTHRNARYDVVQCPTGTPVENCTQTITGTWKPLAAGGNVHMVKAHFHCHAPTCIKVEMWNNDTGKLLCRENTVVGGKGTLPGPSKFDEEGYIAVPPCLWGSAKDGLEAPPLMSNMTIKVVAVTNNTYGHHGEMALPEISFATMKATVV